MLELLLVEDNPAEAEMIQDAFRSHTETKITAVIDGEEALEILRNNARYSEALRPDVILLDLGLPRMGGFEVLQELKSDANLSSIPVIVLTTSDDQEDVHRAHELSASKFITKPTDSAGYASVVEAVRSVLDLVQK